VAKSWTDNAPRPEVLKEHAHLKDPMLYKLKKALLGKPLNRHSLSHQRLSKVFALGVLSSDCISSSAYGSEAILVYLLPAFGLAGFSILIPMTLVILSILFVVTISYRQVVMVYTKAGGSYVVARENFGPVVAQIAAVALMLDYIVTVAVQASAGTNALTSAFASLAPYSLEITLAVIGLLLFGNLKGVKEAGRLFAAPTYLFFGSMAIVIAIGLFQEATGHIHHSTLSSGTVGIGTSHALLNFASIFILLKAFANGGSSLTGLEAISNGVSLFKAPEGNNARRTTVVMSLMLGSLVMGVSWLARATHSTPYNSGTPSVISQIADTVLGHGFFGHALYLFVQFSTMLILYTGANTPFSGFPFLMNYVAEDGYLPRQFSKRGHRLVFSNGIIILTTFAVLLLLVVGANVNALLAFYAIGVFTGFTLAGMGMAKRAWTLRQKNWHFSFITNFLSGLTSIAVVLIFAIVKFTEGAWLVVLIFPIMVAVLMRLHRQYLKEQTALDMKEQSKRATSIVRHDVAVLIDSVDLATVGAIRYARSLNPRDLTAVHFVIDDQRAKMIKHEWEKVAALSDIPLELIDCPDRRLANAAVDYSIRMTEAPDVELTLLLPRRSYSRFLGRILHDQTAETIAAPISQLERVVATIIPFDVEKIISGHHNFQHEEEKKHSKIAEKLARTEHQDEAPLQVNTNDISLEGQAPESAKPAHHASLISHEPVSHYNENILPIAQATWRKRAHVRGQVTSIRPSSMDKSPKLEVEIWDTTGGISLQFIGRREIAGVDVGSTICAEGMVGEEDGSLAILNPSYEIII
jgi:amino acid transporter